MRSAVCTVHGSTIEVSAQKVIDVIRASLAGEPSMYMILKYQQALIFSQVFPIVRKPYFSIGKLSLFSVVAFSLI
jgi:hypothetical protein